MSTNNTKKNVFPEFGRNISSLVLQHTGGDKRVFAAEIGAHYDSVRRWCNGEDVPSGAYLMKIKEKYNISIDWLLTGQDMGDAMTAEWPAEIQDACRTAKRIIESDDKRTAKALIAILDAFSLSIDRYESEKKHDKNHYELKQSSDLMKRELNELKEAVRRLTGTAALGSHTGID